MIATNTSNHIKTSLNESSIIFGVINNLILLIANDIGVEAQFDSLANKSSSVDIAINFNEGIREAILKASPRPICISDTNFTSLWPFYQDWYCFVYSNSKKLTFYRSFITTMTLKDYLLLAAPIAITMAYHFLVMRFRFVK